MYVTVPTIINLFLLNQNSRRLILLHAKIKLYRVAFITLCRMMTRVSNSPTFRDLCN